MFNGFENGTLQPKGTLTRAQMAKLLTVLDQKF
ncbi:MAG: S-layer homology domain-containing protein [Faecousia sp.]